MNQRIIEVCPYDTAWVRYFEQEKALLEQALGGLSIRVHHIGSTSVPGLSAKPIIDILLECESVIELDVYNAAMADIGYTAKGEYGIARRRYFRKGGVQHSHHVHAFRYGDSHVTRHLAFRDYLRAHPDIAADYTRIKQAAVVQANNDIQAYMSFKNDFILHHEQLALAWFKTSG